MDTKRLYRSQNDRMVAGVCGGIAEYLAIDPVIVRLVFVILAFAQGIGLVAYFLCWLLIPDNPNQKPADEKDQSERIKETEQRVKKAADEILEKGRGGSNLVGFILIVIGLIFLIQNIFPVFFNFGQIWPVFIIIAGLWVILGQRKEK